MSFHEVMVENCTRVSLPYLDMHIRLFFVYTKTTSKLQFNKFYCEFTGGGMKLHKDQDLTLAWSEPEVIVTDLLDLCNFSQNVTCGYHSDFHKTLVIYPVMTKTTIKDVICTQYIHILVLVAEI